MVCVFLPLFDGSAPSYYLSVLQQQLCAFSRCVLFTSTLYTFTEDLRSQGQHTAVIMHLLGVFIAFYAVPVPLLTPTDVPNDIASLIVDNTNLSTCPVLYCIYLETWSKKATGMRR